MQGNVEDINWDINWVRGWTEMSICFYLFVHPQKLCLWMYMQRRITVTEVISDSGEGMKVRY